MNARRPRRARADGGRPPGSPLCSPLDVGVARPPAPPMQTFRGIPVSPGIAIGPARSMRQFPRAPSAPRAARFAAEAVPAESSTGSASALGRSRALRPRPPRPTPCPPGSALQYARHPRAPNARMIADPSLLQLPAKPESTASGSTPRRTAVSETLDAYAARLESLSNPHLAARAADVRDIQGRILGGFAGEGAPTGPGAPVSADVPVVVLAADLSPSETAALDTRLVLGFATEAGGRASHTAIVAEGGWRSPPSSASASLLDAARAASAVIVDGDDGLVILDPDAPTLERYRRVAGEHARAVRGADVLRTLPAVTLDGVEIASGALSSSSRPRSPLP